MYFKKVTYNDVHMFTSQATWSSWITQTFENKQEMFVKGYAL